MTTLRPGKPPGVPDIFWHAGDFFIPEPFRSLLDIVFIDPVNGWTFVHMFSGYLAKKAGLSKSLGNLLHLGWEIFQIQIGMTRIDEPREQLDVLLDSAAFAIGQTI